MSQNTLTFQQVSDKLIKVEEALKLLAKKPTRSKVEEKKMKTLELIRESLMEKKTTLVEQQKSTFVTTKAVTADQGEINVLKRDPNIKSMEDSTGRKLKEQDSDIALNLDYVGKTLTDLFVDFLRDMGEEISETTYTAEGDSKIKVQVHYKEGTKKEYTFELRGTQLFLDDTFLIEIQRLPSGEIQIPKETLNSSLYKHFENQLEYSDMPVAETVVDTEGSPLFIGDKIQVGKIIFEICLDSEKNIVYLKTGKNVVYGGTKKFQTLLENSTKKHTEELLTESVEVGDRVKISKSYGGAKGTVVDKRGSFIVLDNGESYHESDVVNISRKLGEDIDVGHVDDEPGMLLQTVYETAIHAASIYKQLKHYQAMHEEVDFPNWWQSKVILAKDYIAKADKWLEFATQENEIIPEGKNQMADEDKIWLAGHLGYKAVDKGYERAFDSDPRAVALLTGSEEIADKLIQAWYRGWDEKYKWNTSEEPDGYTLQETKINTKRK